MWIIPLEWMLLWWLTKTILILLFLFSLQAWSPHLPWDAQLQCFMMAQPGAIVIGWQVFKIIRAVRRWRRQP